jgi:hypothetical protein
MSPGKWSPGKDHDACKPQAAIGAPATHAHTSGATMLSPLVSAMAVVAWLVRHFYFSS